MKKLLYFACIACVLFLIYGCDSSSKPKKGIVTFYGTVTDSKTGTPISGVQIKMGGSDATITSSVTGSDGTYELPLAIIPTEKGSTIRFVLVAQKKGARTEQLSHYISLGDDKYVSMSSDDYVAYASTFETGWEIVGEKVQQSFSIEMNN